MSPQFIPRALSIAGSDSGGGAGIQADLKTFSALGVYGMSAITAVTAQNTLGVQQSQELPLDVIEQQVRSVALDIGVDTVKTGMLSSPQIVELVARLVGELRLTNLVVDPVMTDKGGHPLLALEAKDALLNRLFPLATVVTPNLDEAEVLLGGAVRTLLQMRAAAEALRSLGPRVVVVKGGHLPGGDVVDVIFDGLAFLELRASRHPTVNTHGTGCVFSAAIAAGLANGLPTLEAVRGAKGFVTRAIEGSLALGRGRGPVDPMAGVSRR